MKLLRLCQDQIRLDEPLPWSVRNEPGHLLLSKGYLLTDPRQLAMLIERGVYVDQDEFDAHQHELATHASADATKAGPRGHLCDPFDLWSDINKRAATLLHAHQHNPAFKADTGEVSRDIRQVIDRDVEAGMFEMLFKEPDSYAVSHSVQTAFVASLAGDRLGWSDDERLLTSNAALTMNIAMLEMQNMLAQQTTPPTSQQRRVMEAHPVLGRRALAQSGVDDPDWLDTVERHHVTTDGRGLPQDRDSHSALACLIHYADVYLAKISSRASRPALTSNVAARQLYLNADGANNPYAAAIIKEIGIYPPGSCVRLANGDVALVVRRGDSAHTLQVYSVANASGVPYLEAQPHDAAQASYKVLNALPRGCSTLRVSRQQMFGYEVS
jgi:HD-GYP domain-containing protein (c-di-GMP phosphodiesterase class II)